MHAPLTCKSACGPKVVHISGVNCTHVGLKAGFILYSVVTADFFYFLLSIPKIGTHLLSPAPGNVQTNLRFQYPFVVQVKSLYKIYGHADEQDTQWSL